MDFSKVLGTAIADISTKVGGATSTCIAMDVGSTETRFIDFDMQGDLSDIVAVGSEFGIVNKELAYISSPDATIAGNLEAIMVDETAASKTEPQFNTLHVVKGKLLKAVGVPTQRTTANASKIDQQPTYVNILFNIALSIALKAVDQHMIPTNTTIDLTVSLPPEDTTSVARLDLFRARLAGRYSVEFPRLGLTVKFILEEQDILVSAESNAAAVFVAMTMEDENADESDIVGFIDIGGRSAGNSFIIDGTLASDRCSTTPYGGLMMLNEIAQNVADTYNIQPPALSVVQASLGSGQLKIGNRKMDISECITQAKYSLARPIFDDFMRALDNNHLQAQQVARIYCSGRTFGSSRDESGKVTSTSIMTILEDMYKTRSPYTEFIAVPETYPIVSGLVYIRYAKM